MSYTLVLVGGTGQRFGLGLGYLNLLGIAKMPDRVVVVDAEGASGTNRVTTTASSSSDLGKHRSASNTSCPTQERAQGKRSNRIPVRGPGRF